ncbi:hypothetical protein [Salinisphaera orenii]|uniref:hypothetical protein n=1 Tax=Salinisphaera orenii TaxID=856731 RepID=UPI000F4A5E02|nr:hypothetical protein [Salinisphaera halophila]
MIDTHDETKPTRVWCCGECGEPHRWQDAAVECCTNPPYEAWACGRCGEPHTEHDNARLCCVDERGEPLPPSAAELEARGQQRLPLPA